jgi:uroporphyrinogen decarboxylase
MTTLSGKERMTRILNRQEVDRIGLYEHFWGDTFKAWAGKGHIKDGESFDDHFGYDMSCAWVFNTVADLDYQAQVLEETEDTRLVKDGNYAILRRHKKHDTTPEHVDFTVKSRPEWDQLIKPKLKFDRRRINFEGYRNAKAAAARAGRFFCWEGVNVFEMMHPVCGHEYMLMGMLEDPEWVADMVKTFADLTIEMQKVLFAEEGWPDGIWYYEDMGFKERPFMSPDMYRELIQPAHAQTVAYAHENGRPVIMHSCGFVEPLLGGMVEAGIDCLQVIEVKAGMDLLRIYEQYGDRLSLMGGIDVRKLYSNDRKQIDAELEAKIPTVKGNHGYVLHSDHSIPETVNYETYQYFIQRGLELGKY